MNLSADVKYTNLCDISSKLLSIRVEGFDGEELTFRMSVEYTRKMCEQLLKRCDELEGT